MYATGQDGFWSVGVNYGGHLLETHQPNLKFASESGDGFDATFDTAEHHSSLLFSVHNFLFGDFYSVLVVQIKCISL